MKIIDKNFNSFEKIYNPPKSKVKKNGSGVVAPHDSVSLGSSVEKDLTVLYYIDGSFQDINEDCTDAMIHLEKAGSNEDVNLVAQYARIPYEEDPQKKETSHYHIPIDNEWSGVRRYEIKYDPHEEFETIDNLEKWKDIQKDLPDNPFVPYTVGQKYFKAGNIEKAKEYMQEARDMGVSQLVNNPKSSEAIKLRKQFNEKTRHLYETVGDKVKFKSHMIDDLPEKPKMSDSKTLEDFVSWGMEKYPAKNYMIVFIGHGGAWVGASGIPPEKMSKAVQKGVQKANEKTGRDDKIDLSVFNTCYMGNSEALYEMKDMSDISIGSESYTNTLVFRDWENLIKNIQKNISDGESFNPKKFAYDMVEFYRQKEKDVKDVMPDTIYENDWHGTLSAIDNKKFPGLIDSWKNFNDVCKKEGVDEKEIFNAVKNAQNFGYTMREYPHGFNYTKQFVDMGNIMDHIKKSPKISENVKKAADNINKSIKDVLINEQHEGLGMENAKGISIWGPSNYADYYSKGKRYSESVPNFTQKTGWLDTIERASKKLPEDIKKGTREITDKIRTTWKSLKNKNLSPQEREKLEIEMKNQVKSLEFLRKKGDFS